MINKKNNISVLNFAAASFPENIEREPRNGAENKFVSWGTDNLYPYFLFDIYKESADHQSIIDGMVQYIKGGGLKTNNIQLEKIFKEINEDENINDLYHKIILDYLIYGGFNIHNIPTRAGYLSKQYHIDFTSCRTNEDEDIIFFADKWKRYNTKDVKQYNAFDKNKPRQESMFYFKGLKTRGVYPIPLYNGAIRSILTDIEIAKFHYNNVANGFQVNTIINFNNGEISDVEREALEKKINDKFSGTSGSKILITFNEDKDSAVTVEKLNADDFDEQFGALKKDVQNTIFTSHKVTSPALFGIKMENTGFSKTEYEESFEIFNSTIIRSHQEVIENELYKLYKAYIPTLQRDEIYTIPFTLTKEKEVING